MARWAQTTAERFWSKVDKNGPVHPVLLTPCWPWLASLQEKGYGEFSDDGKTVRAHRFAWKEIAGFEIPDGHGVLHHCDVRPCVNYETHLFTGLPRQNTEDMIMKGRMAIGEARHPSRGESHGMSKLTRERVATIRASAAKGVSSAELAFLHGVTAMTIWCVVTRRSWAHV